MFYLPVRLNEGWFVSLNTLVQKLEDREKNSEATIVSAEKDLNLKQQALELHRKKVSPPLLVTTLSFTRLYCPVLSLGTGECAIAAGDSVPSARD